MPTILITGGTGLVGRALTKTLLERNYQVIILTRNEKRADSRDIKLRYIQWDIEKQVIDNKAISEADYIIHLAGAGVADKRWTEKRKKEIVDSRVNSSKLIADSLNAIPNKVKAVVSASAIGWYGADLIPNLSPPFYSAQGKPEEGGNLRQFKESDPPAKDFLGNTCKQWEESIEPVTQSGIRLVKLRTGIVVSKDGGAMKEFTRPMKFGIAAILGNGKQIISWIHIDDLVNMYITAIENEKMHGVYNAVAPQPVSNKELTLQLAKKRKKFFIPVPVPSFILKLVLGEMSIEVLKSATVSSNKIQQSGFLITYPTIIEALEKIV